MSVSVTRNLERERVRRFVSYWDELLELLPEARRQAVEAAGEEIQRNVQKQVWAADIRADSKGKVSGWQKLRMGSKGGWVGISPVRNASVYSFEPRKNFGGRYKQHTWKGRSVTAGWITVWLERGHGTQWGGYAPGRYFYSRARDDALEIGLKAADRVLCRLADEVDL